MGVLQNDINDIDMRYSKVKKKKNYKGFYQIMAKRFLDIFFCLLALPFLLIVIAVVAVVIEIDDPGPVFYSSKRLGRGFREFGMLKFRSMKVNAPDLRNEDGSTFNSRNDPRVTRAGRILRETSIDELPQILNILKGDMSIIGPRAGDVESKDTYNEAEKDKLLVRPGLTGYTQAYYRNNISVHDKRMLDAWYAHEVSFLLDVKIFFRTIKTVLVHENIYTNE